MANLDLGIRFEPHFNPGRQASLTTVYSPAHDFAHGFPADEVDFAGAYGGYQWEIFYHLPMTIAMHLSRNQRYAEAQRWFHFVFDPTDPSPQRVKPLQSSDVELAGQILANLTQSADGRLVAAIDAWRRSPFRPHVVARHRPTAYRLKAVMAYVDNLIAWGDSLFRQDTGETVSEAFQLYALAANVLGPRPAESAKADRQPQTYASLRARRDQLGNPLVHLEAELSVPAAQPSSPNDQAAAVRGLGSALYFGMPRNDKLMSYWDTVADRLFKIRHSHSLHGSLRQQTLLDPPIDPALLARAAAAGLDVAAIVNGSHQPLPLVRFGLLIGKAKEIVAEVKALGTQLLSALERADSEQLALLRSRHESTILGLTESVCNAQWQEARRHRVALEESLGAQESEATRRQLHAAQIREAMAEREHTVCQQQMAQSAEVEQFLAGEKATGQALHTWLKREVRGLHSQCFQFAFDIARKAERALQHELGDPSLSFLQSGYSAGREGLLAGEKLALDLQRMELAYHELNHREYELTKQVSLSALSPLALLQLRATGRCIVDVPEQLFDLDGPGHYFRRIRNVSVSIGCVVGPHASVNCTLTLLKSSIRRSPQLLDGVYGRDGDGDERFSDHFGSMQSIVTSSARNDPGLFEASLRDERYLPFEGSGAVSQWQLELPADVAQFDVDTIADVVLHMRYTAREGGRLLRDAAVSGVHAAVQEGTVRVLSIRRDFPMAWTRFTSTGELAVELVEEHYPFWARRLLGSLSLRSVRLLAAGEGSVVTVTGQDGTLEFDESLGARVGGIELGPDDVAVGQFTRHLSDTTMKDLWLALTFA